VDVVDGATGAVVAAVGSGRGIWEKDKMCPNTEEDAGK